AGGGRPAAVRTGTLRLGHGRGFRLARRSRNIPPTHRGCDHGCPHGPDRHPDRLRSVLCPVGSILWRADGRTADESGIGGGIDRADEPRPLFLADVLGVYDVFRGSPDAAIANAVQVPVNDPLLLIPAMAYVTRNLGFGV